MEVSQEEYSEFYKKQNRQRYLRLQSAKNGDVSIDMFTTDEFNGEDILVDYTQDVEAMVVKRMVINKLYESISLLPEHEQKLIQEHFYLLPLGLRIYLEKFYDH
jgi:DNA-directed RNA polymerase specialized sigma subunit